MLKIFMLFSDHQCANTLPNIYAALQIFLYRLMKASNNKKKANSDTQTLAHEAKPSGGLFSCVHRKEHTA